MKFLDNFSKTFNKLNPNNYTIADKKHYEYVEHTLDATLKAMQPARGTDSDDYISSGGRASLPLPYLDTPTGSKVPLWRLHPHRMFEMAENIGDLRAVYETIQREMFKNGIKIEADFKYKCLNCLKTFKEKPLKNYVPMDKLGKTQDKEELQCDECDNNDPEMFAKPDPDGRSTLQTFISEYVNTNDQSLVDVAKQYERDLDIIDYAVTVVTRKYAIGTPDGTKSVRMVPGATKKANIKKSEIDELIRVHPVQLSMIANDEGKLGIGADNNPRWICPNYQHRDKLLEKPYCDKCGCEAFTAVMETNSVPFGLPIANPRRQYYAKHEIIWTPGKYHPDLLYGLSPLVSIWKKVMSLFHQDEYIWKYFDKERPPKSILGIGSRNYETVQSFYDRQKQGARADPYMPRPILLNTPDVGSALQYIDLTPNFKELELTALRTEMRQIISSIYGVQPVFYGEQTKAGIGNESLQVTITNKTIKGYQRILNEKFFRPLSKMLGVEDWHIELIDSEEIDKLRDHQIKGAELQNAQMMYAMGFDIWTDGNGNFQFSQFPNPERQMMMGGLGSNVREGETGKVKSTKAPGEKSTNFGGEPLMNRPSDTGGQAGGSPSAGQSYSNKGISEANLLAAREVMQKGAVNGWTLTTMAKRLSEDHNIEKGEALNIIKFLIMNV
ncbi:hypothetical protein [Nitrosopumilus sp.]|uniref:hypothetical protein n=1 Tax=Nitrosopumilus sp. TaxID=2024843 RepID=UPI003D109523